MSDITVGLIVDTVQAQLAIQDIVAQGEAATQDWARKRQMIISGIRQTMSMISSLMSSFRQGMSLIGQQIDPFFSALIGMVISTVSMLLSVGVGLVGTGIGSAAGAVVIGIAVALNILTTAKLVADQLEIKADFSGIREALKAVDTTTPGAQSFQRMGSG